MKVTTSASKIKMLIQISGDLDEEAHFEMIDFSEAEEITVDTAAIGMINSCGIRTWLTWISTFPSSKKCDFINCPKVFVDSANMIRDFIPPHATLRSVTIPYFCESCSHVTTVLLANDELKATPVAENESCVKCGETAELDVFPDTYLRLFRKRSPA